MLALYIILGIVALVLLLFLAGPASYRAERSTEIKRSAEDIFQYVRSLKKQDDWSPWGKRDPDMKKEFEGTDGEVGAISRWEGNKEVGSGEQEITRIIPGQRIESELRFLKPWKSTSQVFIDVEPVGAEHSKVTWGFEGKSGFPMRIMLLFMNMDKMIGKDFEEGLADLKQILES